MYTHTHIYTTCTYLLTDFDECADGIGSYSRYLFPFGDENGDMLSGLTFDGFISIQLNTDFVFHSTNYTTVFVSLKLVTSFLVLIILFYNKIWIWQNQYFRYSIHKVLSLYTALLFRKPTKYVMKED